MENIKIIKFFQSNEYAINRHNNYKNDIFNGPFEDHDPFLDWGLSSNGDLCCRGYFAYCSYPNWIQYEHCLFSISIQEMKKIINEFGHLLVFI